MSIGVSTAVSAAVSTSGHLASSPLSAGAYVDGGLAVLFLILFAETGLLIGFFLPGDTLLLLAGYHTVSHDHKAADLDYWAVVAVCIAGAIIGAQTGFVLGKVAGERLFDTPARRERVARAHKVLHRFGEGKAVFVARFIPLVRTFMNPAVGVTGMRNRDFAVWNIVGAVVWCPLVLAIGQHLPKGKEGLVDKVIIAIVVVSLSLPLIEAIRRRRRRPVTQ